MTPAVTPGEPGARDPMLDPLTFEGFSALNRARCRDSFHRQITPESAVAFALGVGEEAGEVLGAVRAFLGITKRKTVTREDIGAELADVVSYCDLLAECLGMSLADCLANKFDKVSERVGSPLRINAPTGTTRGRDE